MEEMNQIEEPRIEINWLEGVNLSTVTRRSWDGSYVVTRNGVPYHVPNNEEFADFYAQLDEYVTANPEVVTIEEPYVPTAEELAAAELAKAKAKRAAAVATITVEVDGMTFDGDEKAQERMARTVTAATATGASMDDTTTWVLHDNTIAQVTVRQLATALRMAGEVQTALWVAPYTSNAVSSYTPAS